MFVIERASVGLLKGGLGYLVSEYSSVFVIERLKLDSSKEDSDKLFPSIAQSL